MRVSGGRFRFFRDPIWSGHREWGAAGRVGMDGFRRTYVYGHGLGSSLSPCIALGCDRAQVSPPTPDPWLQL